MEKFLPSLKKKRQGGSRSSSSHSEYIYRGDTANKRNQSYSTQTGRGQGEGGLDMKLPTKGGPHQCSFHGSVEEVICPSCVLLVKICRAHA